MDAVTYPNEAVAEFIMTNLIPLRIQFDAQPYATDFSLKWTPTLITLDTNGIEHHRTVGFLAPEELIASLLLGMGKSCFELGKFEEAISFFNKVIDGHPKSHSTPEAIYLRGVATYKSTNDAKPLRMAYDKLKAEYASSEWTMRAQPYSLIG
jgi:tetratricopeptide (TPR) repeat protein